MKHTDRKSERVESLGVWEKIEKNWNTGIRVWKTYGARELLHLICVKVFPEQKRKSKYEKWIKRYEKEIYKTLPLRYNPLISVIIPVYNVESALLIECIESVRRQTYKNWQICLADDASTWKNVRKALEEYEADERIKIIYRQENGHISRSTNSALALADGEFVAFMDCDDTLAPNALYEVVRLLNEDKRLDFIYSDEDKMDEKGEHRHYPHFKGGWSPDTLLSLMYTSHLGVYRRKLVEEVGGLRIGYEGAQDYDLTLRITEKTDRIGHIAKVLYHWRERKESTATDVMAKPYILEAQKKAKEDALRRRGLKGSVEFVEEAAQFRVNYEVPDQTKISIIIPSKDNYGVLKRCVESIVLKSSYSDYEIIVVDNGSNKTVKQHYTELCREYGILYLYEQEDFNFSRMCNRGAAQAKGDLLLFLNDDTEVIEPEWLERMAGHASLPHVGAVGAKLFYPESHLIQHSGVVNVVEGPSHILCQVDDRIVSDFARNRMDYNYIAVTGACLMVAKTKFEEINCFDEDLPIAYNDVDLCFKLVEHGYYNVQRNDVKLFHYESLSRGDDRKDKAKFKRLALDRAKLYKRHESFYEYDPFYSYYNRDVYGI